MSPQRLAGDGRAVILVRPETKPDDVHGMLAAEGILTTRGGRTSHAALVARQFGKPAVVGVNAARGRPGGSPSPRGRPGDRGGRLAVTGRQHGRGVPRPARDLRSRHVRTAGWPPLLSWADEHRRLGIRANADYPEDAKRAREYGAEGIGLCRTEHMFFQPERLPVMQRMIMSAR